jgi:hypothetical protein
MLGDITNHLSRFDELNKKLDFDIACLKKINSMFKQMKKETTYTEPKTFAGNPIKLIRDRKSN